MSDHPGLTIFAIPKRFDGHFGVIQRNAIRSWARLEPAPQIILLGADDGTAEMAAEIGARHVSDIASSRSGAPMFDDVIAKGQRHAQADTVCFLNADIVLTPAWNRAAWAVRRWRTQYLMVGRRWNLDVTTAIDFARPQWSRELVDAATQRNDMASNMFIDYFLFPRGMLTDVPPFVIGRPGYDNWLLWSVRHRRIPLIDATREAPVVHQNHDYSHIKAVGADPGGRHAYLKGEDTRRNAELAGGWRRYFTTDHATHVVSGGVVRRALERRYLDARIENVRRYMVDVTRPIRRKLGIDQASVDRVRRKLRGDRGAS
jgi:hypothetical protein